MYEDNDLQPFWVDVNGTQHERPFQVDTEYCLEGQHFGQTCCASTNSAEDGSAFYFPDFSDLLPAPKEGCNSDSAQYIVNSRCLGQASCNFTVDMNHTYEWDIRSIGLLGESVELGCGANLDENVTICREKLGSPTSNFSNCDGVGGDAVSSLTINALDAHFTLFVVGTCWQDTMKVDGTTYQKLDVAMVFAYLDAFFISIFIYLLFWLQDRELASVEMQDAAQVTAADFTVRIRRLPSQYNHATTDVLRRELMAHFERTLTLEDDGGNDDDHVQPRSKNQSPKGSKSKGEKESDEKSDEKERASMSPLTQDSEGENGAGANKIPVANVSEDDKMPMAAATSTTRRGAGGVRVIDVNFGFDDHNVLRATRKRGEIGRRLDLAMTKARLLEKYGASHCCSGSEAAVEAAQREVRKLTADFLELCRLIDEAPARRLRTAFVTFETQKMRDACLKTYGDRDGFVLGELTNGLLTTCCQPRELKFEARNRKLKKQCGRFTIRVTKAPEPENIIWENLGLGLVEVVARRTLSFALTLAVLFVGFALIVRAMNYQDKVKGGQN